MFTVPAELPPTTANNMQNRGHFHTHAVGTLRSSWLAKTSFGMFAEILVCAEKVKGPTLGRSCITSAVRRGVRVQTPPIVTTDYLPYAF
jgi:hypothetical protein